MIYHCSSIYDRPYYQGTTLAYQVVTYPDVLRASSWSSSSIDKLLGMGSRRLLRKTSDPREAFRIVPYRGERIP